MSKRTVVQVVMVASLLLSSVPAFSQVFGGPANTIRNALFANLGSPTNGNVRYCTNCAATAPCTGGGTGAFAYRTAGAWNCNTGSGGGSAPFADNTALVKNSADATKTFKVDTSGVTTGNLVTLSAGGTAAASTLSLPGSYISTTNSGSASNVAFGVGAANSGWYTSSAGSNIYASLNGVNIWAFNDTAIQPIAAAVNLGLSAAPFTTTYSKWYAGTVGSSVTAAATITPTAGIFHVTGTTQITTVNLPSTGFTGCIRIIPDAAFTTGTTGNIALASTAVVKKVLELCYDGTSWFPSY